jgi:hypothetical protein
MLNSFSSLFKQPNELPEGSAIPKLGMAAGFTKPPGDEDDPMEKEMKTLYKKPLRYNNNVTAAQAVRNVSKQTGVSPELLFSSAFQEGMNKAIAKPDEVSEAYDMAKVGNDFPVDGFYNYGLDTIGNKYELLKKYLPEGFDSRMKFFDAINEKNEKIKTAAFKTDTDALTAKAAFLMYEQNNVDEYAKKNKLTLDDDARNYFTLAAYNTGFPNAEKMLSKYMKAKDKKAFITKGDSEWQKVHKNIVPRMKHLKTAKSLLEEKE